MSLMITQSKLLVLIFLFASAACVQAQDVLKALEEQSDENIQNNTIATFMGTRLSIGHSVQTRDKGALEVSWMNRFWNRPLAAGETTQTFGADKLNSRIGVDYSLTDRFTLGTGYSSGYRSIDLYGKYRLFYQRDSGKKSPFSITLFQNIVYRDKSSLKGIVASVPSSNKFAATTQILVARKITKNFSFQLAPSFVYRAEEKLIEGSETLHFALGLGARYKVGNHVSLVSEYYYVPSPVTFVDTYGPFSLGVNWEVSDLLLQFKLTNARNLVEDKTIIKTENNFNFRDGNLHFGFHATYFIQL